MNLVKKIIGITEKQEFGRVSKGFILMDNTVYYPVFQNIVNEFKIGHTLKVIDNETDGLIEHVVHEEDANTYVKITGSVMNYLLKGETLSNEMIFAELLNIAKINGVELDYVVNNTNEFIASVIRSINRAWSTIISDDSFNRKVRQSV